MSASPTPASIVAICNRALGFLGADRITALDEDSAPARLCSVFYDNARDASLRAYPWNFAIRRATLAEVQPAPAWGYQRAFQLPEGPLPEYCLRVLDVDGAEDLGVPYAVEGRRILTDLAAPLLVRYLARVEDAAQYDSLFADTLAARLAVDLAYPLTASGAMVEQMLRAYQMRLAEARAVDAREGSAGMLAAPEWLDSRM